MSAEGKTVDSIFMQFSFSSVSTVILIVFSVSTLYWCRKCLNISAWQCMLTEWMMSFWHWKWYNPVWRDVTIINDWLCMLISDVYQFPDWIPDKLYYIICKNIIGRCSHFVGIHDFVIRIRISNENIPPYDVDLECFGLFFYNTGQKPQRQHIVFFGLVSLTCSLCV